jgi:hypothetical protein
MNREPLVAVSRLRIKCPVCSKRDNCAVSEDGRVAFCRRVASDKPGRGGWTHILTAAAQPIVHVARVVPCAKTERAPIEHRDGIYCALLRRHLTLSDGHRSQLRSRGLSDAEIERRGFKSTLTREKGDEIADALSPYGLEGVPGFYRVGNKWLMRSVPRGVFIPHRNERGQIEGLQFRPDHPGDGGKYRWFSTNPELTDRSGSQRYPGGTASGAPLHHAHHHLLRDAEIVTVTEGALKADVIAYFTQAPVIGVAGVSTFGSDFAERLKRSAPRSRTVRVAYDRLDVRVLTWRAPWKGFDDYLLAQFTGEEAQAA